jgi:hypothetical protein
MRTIMVILAAVLICVTPIAAAQPTDAKKSELLGKVLDDLNTLASEAKDPGSRVGALLDVRCEQC